MDAPTHLTRWWTCNVKVGKEKRAGDAGRWTCGAKIGK
jgi:hypothetical protein